MDYPKILYKTFLKLKVTTIIFAYSPSYNLTPPISRVLIGQCLIFCSLTSPTCCYSPQKCTAVKYKKRQKDGFPIVT